ncbi:hypothetical protein AC623_13340 [Bacillus sp. FJAT-27231]|uniref:hypothetical protein n=1 Tax=Bacillus sp. FJAT-27231 TaxID=1679168 RepID=UPI000670DB0C|nr:hypothetical protein [Bacillus sp. FJAT-27231]KMY54796.1 hypothetical protein AC623_13340 [Bacillus sp. FJAT-27231]
MESIIIAIIVGLISVMTSRLKGEKKEEKKPIERPKRPDSPSVSDVFMQTKKEAGNSVQKKQTDVKERYEEIKRETPRRDRTAGRLSRFQEDQAKDSPAAEPAFEAEADDLVKGIILAEILAPPKALRRK